jgi:uncharacterized membrane protein YgdD (TMEM256/DUF423 family)
MNWTRIAGILGFLAVALGAFGAHALKARLSPEMLAVWQTGVLYHFFHAIALLALSLWSRATGADIRWGAIPLTAGIVLFSGSLYALALTGQGKIFGPVTPLGGVAFLAGWTWIAFRSSNHR